MQALRFSFEPADIVNEVMSFGSPTPVEVVVHGPNLADDRTFASEDPARAGEGRLPSATSSSRSRSIIPTVDVESTASRPA